MATNQYDDIDLEDNALTARNQGTIAASYARHLLDHAGDIALTAQEANALLFAIGEWEDKCKHAAKAWARPV